ATHHMRVDYSMFEGYRVKGNARTVLSRGEVIVDGGRFLGGAGPGQYLKRAARGGAWSWWRGTIPLSTTRTWRPAPAGSARGDFTTMLRSGWRCRSAYRPTCSPAASSRAA